MTEPIVLFNWLLVAVFLYCTYRIKSAKAILTEASTRQNKRTKPFYYVAMSAFLLFVLVNVVNIFLPR
jgi:uncharacterized membrane protein YkvI